MKKRKIIITYDDGVDVREFKMESPYINGPAAEDIAAAARLLLVMVSYSPEVAKNLVFVDKEDRMKLGIEDGSFFGELK